MNTSSRPARGMLLCLLVTAVAWALAHQMSQWARAADIAAQPAPVPAPDMPKQPAEPSKEPLASPAKPSSESPSAQLEDRRTKLQEAEDRADAALAAGGKSKKPETVKRPAPEPTHNLIELYQKGGVLMYPITLLSLVVVCFGFERFLGLRRGRVAPRALVKGLRKLAAQPNGCDPRQALELCNQHASSAATVIKALVKNLGSPDAEAQQAVSAANDREATRLYFHVRWLNMAMSVAPMLGLLGTVQGMIIVFMGATHLGPGVNKAEYMAEGIYLKLICTFAGLVVAIPAAVLSYLFEARIQGLLNGVEDLATELLPKMQTFEKRRRRDRVPE